MIDQTAFRVIIPALNEEATVRDVVRTALRAPGAVEVIVVDNGSSDQTAAIATKEGARVLTCKERGKGQALRYGLRHIPNDELPVVFLDADLVSLESHHVSSLINGLGDGREMTCGLLSDTATRRFLHWMRSWRYLPTLTGQRAVTRQLLACLSHRDYRGYRIEAGLNWHGWRHAAYVHLQGVSATSRGKKATRSGKRAPSLAVALAYVELTLRSFLPSGS